MRCIYIYTSLCCIDNISMDCGTGSIDAKLSLIVFVFVPFLLWYSMTFVMNSSKEKSDSGLCFS